MAITIAVAHAKGGAGKTSLTANLGYALARAGSRVLLVDLDKQMSLTRVVFGPQELHEGRDIGGVIRGELAIREVVIRSIRPNLDLAPAKRGSTAQALDSVRAGDIEALFRLRAGLDVATDEYDYILIDTPGEQGPAMEVALLAADKVLIPLVPERMCVDGAITTLDHIEHVREIYPELSVLGFVFLKTGGNANVRVMMENLARDIARERTIPVLRNKIPTEARFLEAEAVGMPIGEYDPSARTAISFRSLAEEIATMLHETVEAA